MKVFSSGRLLGALAAAGLLFGLSAASAPQGVQVGEQVSYSFRSAPLNAMGVTSLADLLGKPVVIEFWGTR